jgi:hypothetical protein
MSREIRAEYDQLLMFPLQWTTGWGRNIRLVSFGISLILWILRRWGFGFENPPWGVRITERTSY